jgi:hypothetical protein
VVKNGKYLIKIIGHFLNEIKKDKSGIVSNTKLQYVLSNILCIQPSLFCFGKIKEKIMENVNQIRVNNCNLNRKKMRMAASPPPPPPAKKFGKRSAD